MAKLTLIPSSRSGIEKIRLSTGKSCSIGSSTKADYTFLEQDIDPIHCRLSCRRRLGFVECIAESSTIAVNGITSNRSKLSDGDNLQIGSCKFVVEICVTGEMEDSESPTLHSSGPTLDFPPFDSASTDLMQDDSAQGTEDAFANEDSTVSELLAVESQPVESKSQDVKKISVDQQTSAFLKSLVKPNRIKRINGNEALTEITKILKEEASNRMFLLGNSLEIVEEVPNHSNPFIILISQLRTKEMKQFLKNRNLRARIRQPLGLQRYLDMSPDSALENFFANVTGCVVSSGEENGIELIRFFATPN